MRRVNTVEYVEELLRKIRDLKQENESLRANAERFKWLNRQRSQVWRMLAEMPMSHTAPYIDAAISSTENP